MAVRLLATERGVDGLQQKENEAQETSVLFSADADLIEGKPVG